MEYLMRLIFMCSVAFFLGVLIGVILNVAPGIRLGLRKSPSGFSDEELRNNMRLRSTKPASENEDYSRTPTHME